MLELKTVGRFAFSAILFVLLLYVFDVNSVVETMAGVNLAFLAIAVGCVLGAQFIAAIRLNRLLLIRQIRLGLSKVFYIGLTTIFYGLVIPGGTVAAFVIRFAHLSRNARAEDVAAALLIDRVAATLLLLIIGVLAIAFEMAGMFWGTVIMLGMLSIWAIVLCGSPYFSVLTEKLNVLSDKKSKCRWGRIGARISRALLSYLTISRKQLLMLILISVFSHLIGCVAYFTVAVGMGLDLSFLTSCWVRSGMILSTMVPVTIAGLGLREITAVALLVPIGMSEVQALGFSIIIFLVTPVIVGLLGGLIELFVHAFLSHR